MKKEFLHIFSFVMIAIFTFSCIGAVSAEETFDIPVIEEVSEEELAEVLPEEEAELYEETAEVTKEEAEAALYDGENFSAYYASFEDAVAAVTSGTFDGMPTIKLLKDVLLDSNSDTRNYKIVTGKEFVVDGTNPNGGTFKIEDGNLDWNTDKTTTIKTYSIHMDGTGTKLIAKNVTFTRSFHKSYAFFHIGAHATLELSDNAKIGGTAESYLSGGNGSAVFIEAYGDSQVVPGFIMNSDTAVIEYCKGSGYGTVGVFAGKNVPEFRKGTIRNCQDSGGAIGISGSKDIIIEETFRIENCAVGIGGKADSVVKINTPFTITGCTKGITLESGATLDINANVKISGGTYCIYAADKSIINLNSPITMSGAATTGFALAGEDIITFGANFSGDIYAMVGYTSGGKTYDGIWIGHLADGVENLNGNVYYGKSKSGHKGVFHESLMGSGKITVGEKEYSLKKSFADTDNYDIPAKGVVFDYPLYIRTGTEDTGFKRVAFETFKEAYNLGSTGETIYLLKDLNDNDGISLNATTTPTGGEAVLSHFNFFKSLNINGNGHKITKENSVAKYLFAVYSNAHFNVKNIVYDGSGLGAFAYINAHGGGGTISVDNCLVYNGLGGNAGAFYTLITDSASTSAAVINIKDTTIASCSAPNGGAIYAYYRSTINLENVEITDCSTVSATTGNGGAVYIASGSKLNLKGRINISDNKKGTSENNIYLPGTNQITITGDISEGSLIGLSMAQSGATFGTVADGVDVDKTMFFADGAVIRNYTSVGVYTERKINAAFYPETVGDGKLNETVVIDVNDINEKKNSRTNELVLHWPWLLERGGKLYGYADFLTAYSWANASDAVLYCQKDITIEHLWGKAIDDKNDFSSISKMTEFTMYGETSNYAHTDMLQYLTLDGNGHIIDVDKKDGNAVFSLQWGNRNLTLNNFIYDGQKPFAVVHKSAAVGTETITVNNSYMTTVDDYPLFTVGKGGTINIIDSTLEGKIQMEGVAEDTANSKPEYRSKFNLYGNASVKGLGINIGNTYVDGCIDKTYTGNSVVGGDVSQLKAGEGFTSLESVSSITKAGSNGETFAYYDEANKKFAWTMAPELTLTTDSGKYSDELGTIRFLTTFNSVDSDAVASYGTYAVGASSFDENAQWQSNQFREFDKTPGADKVYYVDAVKIPAEHFDTEIAALSFVRIKGIKTPIYYDFNLASVNKNDTETGDGVLKNLGDPAYTEA
ncbi:MAG: hypothetical protein IJD97_02340 [Clostridia bacterium]|nr:hypothetical protein [Clostridia bacterium]